MFDIFVAKVAGQLEPAVGISLLRENVLRWVRYYFNL